MVTVWSLVFSRVPNAAVIPESAALTHASEIVSGQPPSAVVELDAAVDDPWPQPVSASTATSPAPTPAPA